MFVMQTGQQPAPWGCDHHKEWLVCIETRGMQISAHKLGQGVEVGSFVQNCIWSKSFLDMFSKENKIFLS